MHPLTKAHRELAYFRAELAKHKLEAEARSEALKTYIRDRLFILETSAEGLDFDLLEKAKKIVYVNGLYEKAGTERASVIRDAIKQLATRKPIRPWYGDLWRVAFCTKSYDRWHGQRSDHEYGYGPKHGAIIFSVGLARDVRERDPQELTNDEVEAAIYYLMNLERVQAAEQRASA